MLAAVLLICCGLERTSIKLCGPNQSLVAVVGLALSSEKKRLHPTPRNLEFTGQGTDSHTILTAPSQKFQPTFTEEGHRRNGVEQRLNASPRHTWVQSSLTTRERANGQTEILPSRRMAQAKLLGNGCRRGLILIEVPNENLSEGIQVHGRLAASGS